MRTLPFSRACFFPLLLIVVCCFDSCSVPLAPGYTIEKQSLELQFQASPEPHLSVHCSYLLVNTGNQPLHELRIALPLAEAFHRASTQAEIDGQPVEVHAIAGSPTDRRDTVELHWNEPWTQKQKRTLVLTYSLSNGFHLGSYLAASTDTFFAFPDSWDPALLPPRHLFGKGGVAPKKWNLSVRAPSGFLVHASGTPGKRLSDRNEWIYQFEQHPRDFAPFAAGGKYSEQAVRAQGEDILFWTLEPVVAGVAKTAAETIASRVHYYASEYGNPRNGARAIHLLECVTPDPQFGCGALPETVFVHQEWIARGLKEKAFFDDVSFELAYTWFGGVSRVRFDLYPLPMDAAAPYAGWESQAVEEGGDARQARIRELIEEFEKQVANCKEKILLPAPAGDHGCSYSAAWTKSGLLFFALEDRVGRSGLHKALRHMIQARRAQDFSVEDLIASVEAEAHQPQGEFFRLWMKQSGIPDEFRARYAGAAAPANHSSEEPKP